MATRLRKIVIPLTFSICTLLYIIIAAWKTGVRTIKEDGRSRRLKDVPGKHKTCGNPSFVYVKTHKTGSSTVKVILSKHLKRHVNNNGIELSKIPAFPFPFVGGYPGSFQRRLSVVADVFSEDGKRPSFLMDHFRFDKKEVQAVMNPEAKYITIIRNPMRQFLSAFNYYYARYAGREKKFTQVSCHGHPYLYVTGGTWMNISEYLMVAETRLNESAPWFFRTRNYQSYDLGLDPLNLEEKYVRDKAEELDNTFHLVLILDRLLESLILLKDLLCMQWSDIVLSKVRARKHYDDHVLTEKEISIINMLTKQDQILYQYFNASLERKIEAYGKEKMAMDVARLEKYIAAVSQKQRNRSEPYISSPAAFGKFPVRERLSDDAEAEILMTKLREKSAKDMVKSKIAGEVAHYMVENYGWCPVNDFG